MLNKAPVQRLLVLGGYHEQVEAAGSAATSRLVPSAPMRTAWPMCRVETQYLDNPKISSADLAKKVTCFFNSPTCGGTAIDSEGNLYVADANEKRILNVTPDARSSVLVQDPRLI
ncbi:hypothetical protein QMK33_19135 [Hymenobacter sp. H14-R3]|uniref:hypothetical protein n=1 Tax=Hymenobacter sp. H14-R3 TaxID=3046308 RepID=UPI0024B952CA|nr:hypothetical protein [Hymenobacter sp. H14-R3]MDJ0367268.1 hypothetical protein [Hymenobacter sp. H14-R3]